MQKDEVARVLQRAGLPHELIDELVKELPDTVDLDRDAEVFDRHGLTHARLTDMMGGSP